MVFFIAKFSKSYLVNFFTWKEIPGKERKDFPAENFGKERKDFPKLAVGKGKERLSKIFGKTNTLWKNESSRVRAFLDLEKFRAFFPYRQLPQKVDFLK